MAGRKQSQEWVELFSVKVDYKNVNVPFNKFHTMMSLNYKIILLSFLILFSGCIRQNVKFSIKCLSDCNENNTIRLRFYQLKGKDNFNLVKPESIWLMNDEKALGGDFIDKKEIVVSPVDKYPRVIIMKLDKNTEYIGVAANFYHPDLGKWKYLNDKKSLKSKTVRIEIGANFLRSYLR